MAWLIHLPIVVFTLFAFVYGLVIGSFLNVLIARLPFEKSVLWPGSRCFTCFTPIGFWDNMPILGYLRLRGKCRACGTHYSSRYLWVELGTGLAFMGLFLAEVVFNTSGIPGLKHAVWGGVPSLDSWLFFFAHTLLLGLLIAASVIDIQYKVVPPQITVCGTILGIIISTLLPWPWPSAASDVFRSPLAENWSHPVYEGKILTGLMLWPAWDFGSFGPLTGFLSAIIGAAAGQALGRGVKFVFEAGFGREALGVGDADLLMMAGAMLGWQPVVLAFFVGATVLLPIVLVIKFVAWLMKVPPDKDPTIPFGPGIALGIVIVWLGWPLFGELVRTVFFEPVILGMMVFVMTAGLLLGGVLINFMRGKEAE